jgi:two-component system sensor histidine kinase DegS
MDMIEAFTSFKSLILNMTLVVTLSYLISQTKIILLLKKSNLDWKELIILTGLFGGLSVLGWYFGVQYGTLIANMRYIPGIVGGLYGGPVVGIGSFFISGLFRLTEIGGTRAFITGIAMGMLAGFMGRYLKQKRLGINTLLAFYTVVAAMGLHFFIFSTVESYRNAANVFLNVGWMLYLLNISGVVIFVRILQQEFRRIEHQRALANLAIMEERERIAKDLHDGFAQTMFYLNTKTVTLKRFISGGSKDRALDELEQVKDVIKQAFTDIRQTIFNLRTVIDLDSDLFTTLKEYLQRFQFQTGIAVEFISKRNLIPKFPLEVEIHLFRIVQEALNNALKHAQATKVTLEIITEDDMMTLIIGDNGKGFNLINGKPNVRKKYGILNMQERAWSVGARFQIDSQIGQGTRIIISLPLQTD